MQTLRKGIPMNEITYCSSCGKPQYPSQEVTQPMVVTQNKNLGTAVLITLNACFFGFQGIGHMYIGKTSKGIGLLLIGWLVGIYIVLFTFGGVLPMTIILESIILSYWI